MNGIDRKEHVNPKYQEVSDDALISHTEAGDLEACRESIRNGASPNNVILGESALHTAVRLGNKEITLLLLENGGRVNLKAAFGDEPIHAACGPRSSDHFETFDILLKRGADVDARNHQGSTPLHLVACKPDTSGSLEIMRKLIENGAKIDSVDEKQKTPLQVASRNGYVEKIQLLIDSGARVDRVDAFGQTALCLATREARPEAVRVLLDNGADPRISPNEDETILEQIVGQSWGDFPDAKATEQLIRTALGESSSSWVKGTKAKQREMSDDRSHGR